MGIIQSIKTYEENIILKLCGKYTGLYWCELGNQIYNKIPAKKIYEKLGVKHTSIDLNERDGSLPLNLCNPQTQLYNQFDVITNYGTSEHVNNQYGIFKNIHEMCKINGIMIHGVPLIKNWQNHCRYYYSIEFFLKLSQKCNYKIYDLKIYDKDYYVFPNNLVLCVYIKNDSNVFIQEDEFSLITGIVDNKDTRRTQNYDI
jgi:hypothetical protein